MQLLQKNGETWAKASPPVRVLFGKNGLAWGRGEIVGSGEGPEKVERDNRAPAGVFKIGTIYTYDHSLPSGRRLSVSHGDRGRYLGRRSEQSLL